MDSEERFVDVLGHRIFLTPERWQHIVSEHPEIREFYGRLAEVLNSPDVIKYSRRDRNVLLYYRYYNDIFEGKYLLVVAKIQRRSFVLTCYITDRIREGRVLWKRD